MVATSPPPQAAHGAESKRSARALQRSGRGWRRELPAGPQALQLIQGALAQGRSERQAPWLAGLHRVADTALVSLGCCMLGLSALTLHWQNQWGPGYQRREDAQAMAQRLQKSAVLLEQHHLGVVGRPGWLEPTSSAKLVYLPAPRADRPASSNPLALVGGLRLAEVRSGY